jgi:hypothetical protein
MSANDEWFKKKYETTYNFNKNAETITGNREIPPNVSPFEKVNQHGGLWGSASGFAGTSLGGSYGGSFGNGLGKSANNSSYPSASGYSSQKGF